VCLRSVFKAFWELCMMMLYGERLVYAKIVYYLDRGEYFAEKGVLDRAIADFSRVLDLEHDNFYANLGLAGVFCHKRKFREALDYTSRALSTGDAKVQKSARQMADLLLVVIYEMLGEYGSAEPIVYRIADQCKGDMASVYAQLGRAYFDLGIYDRAELYYGKVVTLCPIESAPHYNLARIYLCTGDFAKAKQELRRALELAEDVKKKKAILHQLSRVNSTPNRTTCDS
jgi:tetratricopeptide (TPR) repeat protein